ncbi:MAG: hypothetical protein KDJ26_07750 [Alphaproteobacteria bacterium]|nr:hypothetical protein [Alphaproteobacteria bacterium]
MVKKFHTTVLGWVIKPIVTIIIGRTFISICSLLGYHPDLWLAELVASMIDHPSAELVEASKWIISAFIAIIIWLLLEVRIKRNSKNSPLDGSIILECTRAKLPRFVPDNGKINILDTQYNARNSSGFGFSIRIY